MTLAEMVAQYGEAEVVWQRGGRHLVLRNAELLRPGGEVAPIDGELVIDREKVEFIQVVGP